MADEMYREVGSEAEQGPEPVPLGRNLITVIGIDEYAHHPTLENPVNDAKAVLAAFRRCGFAEPEGAPSLFNQQATGQALRSLVRDALPDILEPEDSFVLFFAGHGSTKEYKVPDPENAALITTGRHGYLIPVDGHDHKPGDWLRLDSFLEDISTLPARHILIILDACKSGFALNEKFKRRGGTESGSLAEYTQRVSRRVMTSALHDQKAMDGGGGGNSLFTEVLVDAIENQHADYNRDGFITSTDLFAYVRQVVGDEAARVYQVKQTPDYGYLPGDGSGELVLSLRGDQYNQIRARESLQIADHIRELSLRSGDPKQLQSALRYYEEARKFANIGRLSLPQANLGLGMTAFTLGQTQLAIPRLQDAANTNEDLVSVPAGLWLGMAHALDGDYAQAATVLESWQQTHSQSPDASWVSAYSHWLRSHLGSGVGGRHRALLIGIDEYQTPNISPLYGCVNDVSWLIRPQLIDRCGFAAADITLLYNEQATTAAILAAFQHLHQISQPGDIVLVYFSGHSVPAKEPQDLTDSHAEQTYLITHDTRVDDGKADGGISALTLHQLLQTFPAGNTTAILDTHADQNLMSLAEREGTYHLILASDNAETAFESQIEIDGQRLRCGLLTASLYRALVEKDPETLTYATWMANTIRFAQEESDIYERTQTPTFIGIAEQLVFKGIDIYLNTFQFCQQGSSRQFTPSQLSKRYRRFSNRVNVSHPRAHLAYGQALLSKNAPAEAIPALRNAITQDPDHVPPYLALTQAHLQQREYADALGVVHSLLPILPDELNAQVQELTELLQTLVSAPARALLVNVTEDDESTLAALQAELVGRWGFAAADITRLQGRDVTRTALLEQFRALSEAAISAPCLFYFRGSGVADESEMPLLVISDHSNTTPITLQDLRDISHMETKYLTIILDTGFDRLRSSWLHAARVRMEKGWSDHFTSPDDWRAFETSLGQWATLITTNFRGKWR